MGRMAETTRLRRIEEEKKFKEEHPEIKKKRKKAVRLNYKQRKTIQELAKNPTDDKTAMLNAGYSKGYVDRNRNKIVQNIAEVVNLSNFGQSLKEACYKAGITQQYLADKIKSGLEAKKSSSFNGQVIESDVPDGYIQQLYLQFFGKLFGVLTEKIEVSAKTREQEQQEAREIMGRLPKSVIDSEHCRTITSVVVEDNGKTGSSMGKDKVVDAEKVNSEGGDSTPPTPVK